MIPEITSIMRTRLFGLLLFCFFPMFSKAQTWEIGAGLGIADRIYTSFPSDLFKFRGEVIAAQLKRNFDPYWSGRLGVQSGNFIASEPKHTQVSAQVEFNFFKYQAGSEKKQFSPFLLAGFSANPKTPEALNTLAGAGVKYNMKGNWNLLAEYQLSTGTVFNSGMHNYKFAGFSLTYTFVNRCCPLDASQKGGRR
ncbi:MAG: hypothetical protein RI924_681 [Bacteroidota bacterium]